MGVKTRLLASGKTEDNEFNISLLGFKMAVNEGLTVFNLVDGIVDEFHDESGTDEAEGTNDTYCASNDLYQNSSSSAISAGFSMTAITEPQTSTAGTNPDQNVATFGAFTVPTGMTSINFKIWGAGGGTGAPGSGYGGGGGFSSGTLAVTGGQSLKIGVGEGGNDSNDNLEEAANTSPAGAAVGGTNGRYDPSNNPSSHGGAGGGGSGITSETSTAEYATFPGSRGTVPAPSVYAVAGAGGGGGSHCGTPSVPGGHGFAGAGGGLLGDAGGPSAAESSAAGEPHPQAPQTGERTGGGGSQSAGGQGGNSGIPGGFMYGGDASPDISGTDGGLSPSGTDRAKSAGGGGGGYYGGGGSGGNPQEHPVYGLHGGGGSSYYGHPQITSGATEEGNKEEGGGVTDPAYVADTSEGVQADSPQLAGDGGVGEDGYILLTGCVAGATTSTTIVSNAFTSSNVPTTSRIVVFEEDIDSSTLNTDIVASISRDGGSTFTTATLSDSGYVTGSSGQRILTGQATISGQPSGQSMRWKLALANNAVKIHGVSLQWS